MPNKLEIEVEYPTKGEIMNGIKNFIGRHPYFVLIGCIIGISGCVKSYEKSLPAPDADAES